MPGVVRFVKNSGNAEFHQLIDRQRLEAVALCRGDELVVNIENSHLDEVVYVSVRKLRLRRFGEFGCHALDAEGNELLCGNLSEAGCFHLRDEFRSNIE